MKTESTSSLSFVVVVVIIGIDVIVVVARKEDTIMRFSEGKREKTGKIKRWSVKRWRKSHCNELFWDLYKSIAYHNAGSRFISLQPSYGISNWENNGKRTWIPPIEFKVQWIECVTMALTSCNIYPEIKRKERKKQFSVQSAPAMNGKCSLAVFRAIHERL